MNDYPQPSITVNVDETNPGQFFACCGLLELADRLWPGAEGWFSGDKPVFQIACNGAIEKLLEAFKGVGISSSLRPEEQKRLATLLSVPKNSLTSQDVEQKKRLQTMWRIECLHLCPPFDVRIDWWRDSLGNRTPLKTWAAKQMVFEMVSAMMVAVQGASTQGFSVNEILFQAVQDDSLPFNFDSDLCRTGNARDAGFSADTLGLKSTYRPLLELLAFVGLQRFRPNSTADNERFIYCMWTIPLAISIAGAAASAKLQLPNSTRYAFGLFHRTKYMKAFLPAQPNKGD